MATLIGNTGLLMISILFEFSVRVALLLVLS